jgi:hypothetical protein
MIIEMLVLPVVQKVLTTYITSVMTKRSAEKTRDDLIAAVRNELKTVTEIRDDVKAVHAAMTELDIVVKADRNLDWRSADNALLVRSRRVIPRTWAVDDALRALEASVAERRSALGLADDSGLAASDDAEPPAEPGAAEEPGTPEPAEEDRGELDAAVQPGAPEPADARPEIAEVNGDARLVPPPSAQPVDSAESNVWRQRVLELAGETRRERRQRMREGN